MKKHFLLFYLLITVLMGKSQSYIPSVVEGRKWDITFPHGMGSFTYESYQIACDTLIDNKTYKKVSTSYGLYLGAVREEIDNQKIFFFSKDSVQESLIVNYNLQEGEYFSWGNYSNYIDSVRTRFSFGQNRKVIYFHPGLFQWIEGIGSNFWGIILDQNYKVVTDVEDLSFNCNLTAINSPSLDNNQIQIFSTPNYLIIKGFESTENVNYKIFSLTGTLLKEGMLISKNEIDITDIGGNKMIMIRLETANSIAVKKVFLPNN